MGLYRCLALKFLSNGTFVSFKVHVHVCGIRKNKARETEILRTASASKREEVDKRAGRVRGGDRGREKRPSLLSISSDVTHCQFSNVTFHLYQKMTSQFIYTEIYFLFQLCIYIQHKHSVTSEGMGNREGLLSLPPLNPPPPPPSPFTRHCSILKLHLFRVSQNQPSKLSKRKYI